MDKEIKERIAAINSGIIPEGYKKTKVGIFPQDWKEEKIGELFYKVMERNNGQFDKTKWISVAKMYYQEPEKVTSNNIDTRTYVMRLGDMAFEGHPNKDFLFGRFVVNDLGDGIISELFPIYRHRKQYVTNYWKYAIQFESIMARIYIRCITMSGASSNKINDDEFKKESLFLPPLPEQQKIAEILSTQDKLIELQEKKIEQLKELKKAYLQKMFPQKGSKYPELRFKGFTEAWEQRKLGDVATLTSSKRIHMSDYVANGIPFFRGSEISKLGENSALDDVLYISEELYAELKQKYGVPQENDILITAVGTLGNSFVVKGNKSFYFKDGNLIWLKNINVVSDYLNVFLSGGKGKEGVLNSAAGSNQKALTMIKLKDVVIDCPSVEEQKKIASYINTLDNLITLHQRKSEQEKQKKKALMQLLLTGIVRTK